MLLFHLPTHHPQHDPLELLPHQQNVCQDFHQSII